MKVLLRDFNAEIEREDISKQVVDMKLAMKRASGY
jgi:hypothetical protein